MFLLNKACLFCSLLALCLAPQPPPPSRLTAAAAPSSMLPGSEYVFSSDLRFSSDVLFWLSAPAQPKRLMTLLPRRRRRRRKVQSSIASLRYRAATAAPRASSSLQRQLRLGRRGTDSADRHSTRVKINGRGCRGGRERGRKGGREGSECVGEVGVSAGACFKLGGRGKGAGLPLL